MLILMLLLASVVAVPFVMCRFLRLFKSTNIHIISFMTDFQLSLAESEYKNTTTPVIMTRADAENSLIIDTSVNESTVNKQEKAFSVLERMGPSPGRLILLYSTIRILGQS